MEKFWMIKSNALDKQKQQNDDNLNIMENAEKYLVLINFSEIFNIN